MTNLIDTKELVKLVIAMLLAGGVGGGISTGFFGSDRFYGEEGRVLQAQVAMLTEENEAQQKEIDELKKFKENAPPKL